MDYETLRKQPLWFIDQYQYYLKGKNKAEEAKAKKK